MRSIVPAIFRNPVFEHEFIRYCRTKRWYVVRTGLVGALTLVLWLFFLQGRDDIAQGNIDAVGASLFSAACIVQVLFVLLATPGLTADLIASERRSGNLEVLLSTPLPRRGIVYGKILSRVSLLLVMVASTFPAISITLLFGGVRTEQVVALFLVSVGLILLLSGPSLLLSTIAARGGLPAVLAYLVALVPAAVLLVPTAEPHLIFGAVARLARPDPGTEVSFGFLESGLIVLLAGAIAFLVGAWLCILRIGLLRSGEPAAPPSAGRLGRIRSRISWDRGNPIATWETRRIRGRFGRGAFWTIFFLLAGTEALFLLVPPARRMLSGPYGNQVLVTIEAFVILLFAALSGSTTVVSDREQGRIELFRLSCLTPREVVHGKALGTARAVLPLALLPAVHLLVAGGFGPAAIGGTLLFLGLLSVTTAICAADGVMNSIQGATVQSAILRSIWHFCWLTLFLPLVQVLLPLVFQGTLEMPEGPQFSLLYPLHHAATIALAIPGTRLDLFGFVFWIVLLGIMAVGLFMMLAPAGHRPKRTGRPRTHEPPPFGDWRESWGRLASQWDEED